MQQRCATASYCWWTISTPPAQLLLPAAGYCCVPGPKLCGWRRWPERSARVLPCGTPVQWSPQAKQWGHRRAEVLLYGNFLTQAMNHRRGRDVASEGSRAYTQIQADA